MKPQDIIYSFRCDEVRELAEFESQYRRLTHMPTGLELIHIKNSDPENLFAFIFRTPSHNSTGLPHIMEHSVLCGSRSYPVKDPFLVLLRGSMNTFLNAFTTPDSTIYLASSSLEKDFFNLMAVYGDAVFFPTLKPEVFWQEGIHIEKNNEDAHRFVGIVYNEMKGNYSSAESIVGDWSIRGVFPNTPYHYDSGGDPMDIPTLSYEEFLDFHEHFYHPSNGRVFLYGNIETEKSLELLETSFLKEFSQKEIDSRFPFQKMWDKPRSLKIPFESDKDNPVEQGAHFLLSWMIGQPENPFELLVLYFISDILLGNPGCPLRKALAESGLGQDISPASGLEGGLKEAVFTVGLRKIDPEKSKDVEKFILMMLNKLTMSDPDQDLIQGAIHHLKFRNREVSQGNGPFGIKLMWKLLTPWLHEQDPLDFLVFDQWMDKLEKQVSANPALINDYIKEHILENPHRLSLLVYADDDLKTKKDKMIADLLEAKLKEYADSSELEKERELLKVFQETPDKPEDVEKIPHIMKNDLPKKIDLIDTEKISLNGVPGFYHDIFTKSILYIDLGFDITGFDKEELFWLYIFGKALCESGLPGQSYDQVARQLALTTGGFSYSTSLNHTLPNLEMSGYFLFRFKALEENAPKAISLVFNLLRKADFTHLDHLKNLVYKLRNSIQASLVPSGNFYAALKASASLSGLMDLESRIKGVEQLLFLDHLVLELSSSPQRVVEKLESLRRKIIHQKAMVVNITSDKKTYSVIENILADEISQLPCHEDWQSRLWSDEPGTRLYNGLVLPSDVSFVAAAVKGFALNTKENHHFFLLANLLSTGYLWENIRMKGGAYGASAYLSGNEGLFIFSSYRDPNILSSVKAFEDSLIWAAKGGFTQQELDQAIISTVGKITRPISPQTKGLLSMKRHLLGISDELRQLKQDAIISATSEDLMKAAGKLLELFRERAVSVLASKESLDQAATGDDGLVFEKIFLPNQ
ncbi:MAG: insulinase family protein [Spirochaetales bacterium]|nr:insulinase family protein [Spirochaetales bacterium]